MTEDPEREAALMGPLVRKTPGTPAWAYQMVFLLKKDLDLLSWRQEEYADTLGKLVQHEAWNLIPVGKPYGTPDKMFMAELGITYPEALNKALGKPEPKPPPDKATAKKLAEGRPMPQHGGARHAKNKKNPTFQVDGINLKGGTDINYLARRLAKQDAKCGTDFLADWESGNYTTLHEAAKAAGVLAKKVTLSTTRADVAAKSIIRRLGYDFAAELVKHLSRYLKANENDHD